MNVILFVLQYTIWQFAIYNMANLKFQVCFAQMNGDFDGYPNMPDQDERFFFFFFFFFVFFFIYLFIIFCNIKYGKSQISSLLFEGYPKMPDHDIYSLLEKDPRKCGYNIKLDSSKRLKSEKKKFECYFFFI